MLSATGKAQCRHKFRNLSRQKYPTQFNVVFKLIKVKEYVFIVWVKKNILCTNKV